MRFLVTAGPTREFLDPVRFLSNRSTGRMGYAVARRALDRGHAVTLVSGPVALAPPPGATLVPVVSARDMLAAVSAHLPDADVLVMTAAVADFRPRTTSPRKLKKRDGLRSIELEPNPDILATLRPQKGARLFVGFAAETDEVLAEAAGKLERKGLDLVVANDVGQPDAGFEVETNRVVLLARGAPPQPLPLLPKLEVADRILDWIERARGEVPPCAS
jgi:phosphopantothenoylcysteine decarboxylase / phosphopantothenate---cysteine ligase